MNKKDNIILHSNFIKNLWKYINRIKKKDKKLQKLI